MDSNNDKTWIKNMYWVLNEVSCVLVQRNRLWFNNVLTEFKHIWNTIEQERISGYDHRKPKKYRRTIQNDIIDLTDQEKQEINVINSKRLVININTEGL